MRALLLMIAFFHPPQAPAPLFDLQNPNNLPFPTAKAESIFVRATAEVALAINPHDPPSLQPKVIVRLGSECKCYRIAMANGISTIDLKEWNAPAFARAMTWAASYSVLSPDTIATIGNRVALQVEDTVDVSDLKKK